MNDIAMNTIEILADAGFVPADDAAENGVEEYGLSARDAKSLAYYADRGWDCVRLEPAGMVTWARTSDGRVSLMHATINGVVHAEADFDTTKRGLAWLEAAVNA